MALTTSAGVTLVRQNDEADMWAKAADFAKQIDIFSTRGLCPSDD